jgi:hypothetical protein
MMHSDVAAAPKEPSILARPGRAWKMNKQFPSSGGALEALSAPPELALSDTIHQALPGLANIECSFGAKDIKR